MVTMKEIGKIAGVSIGTVQRALNDLSGINENTKNKIIKIANSLNYQKDFIASSLVKGETKTVGIIVFDLAHFFFSQLATTLINQFRERGYFSYVLITNKSKEEEIKCINNLLSLNIDGILIVPINKGKDFAQYIRSINKPIITLCNFVSKKISFVGLNDFRAMYDSTNFIISKGYSRIVYLSPPLKFNTDINQYTLHSRYNGVFEAVKHSQSKIDLITIKGHDYLEKIKKINLKETKTAILCSSDEHAIHIYNYLSGVGLKIPGDVGIMGFDNIDILQNLKPRITTIDYKINEIGEHVIKIFFQKKSGNDKPSSDYIMHNIIEGGTL